MEGRKSWPRIEYVNVVPATAEHPRNDSASIEQLEDGSLFMVWIQMHRSDLEGHDEAPSSIASMRSVDGGYTWGDHRVEAAPGKGDLSVYNPSVILLPKGELIFFCLRYHCLDFDKPLSSSGDLRRSSDGGRTWSEPVSMWEHDAYGCANHTFTRLSSGRLLKSVEHVPMRGTDSKLGHRSSCFWSVDDGRTWEAPRHWVELPLRGCMENHIAETNDDGLVMVVRNQLGSVFLARSQDDGLTWSKPQTTGLTACESMPSLTRIPGTECLLLIWNNSDYDFRFDHSGKRTPLTCAVSRDGGRSWRCRKILEDDAEFEFTNVACSYTREGKAIITYLTSKMENAAPPGRLGRHRMSLKAAIVPIEWLLA